MKSFLVRIINLAVILGVLFTYNSVTTERVLADQAAKQEAEEQNAKIRAENAALTGSSQESGGPYTDGTYDGEGTGYGGPIVVSAVIEGGWLMDLKITSAEKEDAAYLSMAQDIVWDILDAQSADVDTVTGATYSSTGIKNAAAAALEKAEKH